ncbi:uncharacterized protein G2W53_030884 [Senna tora]|uniref:Uncharacterized protein n=1 Tax=Senna tora TaxID=362788 RepID=A0A834T898_9FABA|nr:uncharacterized protein G2W53_030884 [Senna tora]
MRWAYLGCERDRCFGEIGRRKRAYSERKRR